MLVCYELMRLGIVVENVHVDDNIDVYGHVDEDVDKNTPSCGLFVKC
eukprot:COSAG01_NODE_9583_length_2402_cov_1.595745_2_plen_47_part_00